MLRGLIRLDLDLYLISPSKAEGIGNSGVQVIEQ
jgi:hypothetical protein